mmetsp:Transcript_15534/g.20251  ORF Transcript_15534/g.20251 Transcript_15534/m.20251 type:complete len:95 (-) Transcript_15534:246-530(-)
MSVANDIFHNIETNSKSVYQNISNDRIFALYKIFLDLHCLNLFKNMSVQKVEKPRFSEFLLLTTIFSFTAIALDVSSCFLFAARLTNPLDEIIS